MEVGGAVNGRGMERGISPATGCREGGFPPAPRAGLPSEEGASGIPLPAGSDCPPASTADRPPLARRPPSLLESCRDEGAGPGDPPASACTPPDAQTCPPRAEDLPRSPTSASARLPAAPAVTGPP